MHHAEQGLPNCDGTFRDRPISVFRHIVVDQLISRTFQCFTSHSCGIFEENLIGFQNAFNWCQTEYADGCGLAIVL